MSDLIRREDAIKALRCEYPTMPIFKGLREEWAIKTEGFRKAEEVIMSVPSADIDLSEYSDKLWRNAYERGKADRPQGEWIPCSERLPEERQDVYVTVFWDDYGDTITAYGMRTQFGWLLWNTAEGELLKGYTVTAWMPLPKPYGERKGSE